MTETYTATLDRIVDEGTAVLLLERDGETVEQRTLDVTRLPADGRHEGAVFTVTLEGGVECGDIETVEYRPGETESRRESIQERLDRLSSRLSDRDE
ncbi:Protein of unknown function [Halobiforma haloterrestris]|uniref:DUF3006 family protein n=1 Tax=Natronobacterium haloterrestre TaxID=148448 RepID=A0A1I1LJL0_NATHA|nr:DUF3006 domain-containing protein [Halobiforma haloterrestris]SFC70523.1 Protein of unknown function [Halobiforma haloterrestris]